MSSLRIIIPALVAVLMTTAIGSCGSSNTATNNTDSTLTQTTQIPDTFRVAILYGPTSYFIYRDQEMGYDFSLMQTLAHDNGHEIELTIARSQEHALQLLQTDSVDIVCARIPVTNQYREKILHCGPSIATTQILVQRNFPADSLINDVTELVGRDIYVVRNSKYQQRLQNLNQELGGGLNIHTVGADSLDAEDLIDLVNQKAIPMTVVDSDIARLNATYYPQLNITLPISFNQNARWAVSKQKPWLADSINAWLGHEHPKRENDLLMRRYFEIAKSLPQQSIIIFAGGKITPYDNLFKKYAGQINWDWRLLAAIAYVESRFDPNVTSWVGAKGIMQIMPSTARAFNIAPEALLNNETSIKTAVKIINSLNETLKSKIPDNEERLKFILAAYNAGPAHILDAIVIARKTGLSPQIWQQNVEKALLLKTHPEHYNDPQVKYGYFRGSQTVQYVNEVFTFYNRARRAVKK